MDKLYWEGPIGGRGEAAGALAQSRGGSLQAKRAYFTAQLLNRIQTRYDLRRAEFEYPQKGLVMVSLRASGQKTLIIVWRETYASGQALEASSSLALKTFDIEGPYRQGLKKLPMVPDSNGRLSYQDISGLYFDLDGRPTILSQDEAWLRELTDGFDPFASYPSYAPYPGEGPRREERTPPTPSSNPGIEVRPDGKVYYY
ncbi:MAG: hypothetical protein BWZ10_03291 [candidate division BRC1 bacterium ADurb.BinA364]|nr:MAG: hypothetical protein BWZ10_03291 [candidate division BRC1 bacterium ADurb.BinA364]